MCPLCLCDYTKCSDILVKVFAPVLRQCRELTRLNISLVVSLQMGRFGNSYITPVPMDQLLGNSKLPMNGRQATMCEPYLIPFDLVSLGSIPCCMLRSRG